VPGGFWATIPAGSVTNNGSTLSAWPVSTYQVSGGLYAEAPRSGSGGTALSWDVAATLAALNDHATSQLLFVRAKFVQGANSWFSPYQPMTFNSATMDSSAATTGAGPCQVSLWTGSCEIDAADAAVTTAFGGVLGVDRTFVSSSIPTAGPFGPGWTASLPTDGADVNTLSFNGAEVTVQGPTTTVHFLWDGGSGFPLAPGETGNETLTAVGSGATAVFTFSEPADGGDGVKSDTQQVTFTAFYTSGTPSVSNPWVYKSAQTSPTGPAKSSSVVTTTFNATTGYPTQMLAPQPSGVTCNTTWAVGCEALNFTYNANNEITKVTLKTATSTGTAANTDLACYAYNASKQLTQVWDPRNVSSTCNYAAPVLPTTYAYDGSGRVVSVTPAGLAAWTIDYTSNRVADVKRTHSSAYGGATQQTSFVYNAPIGATSSANYPDLSAGTAATWGQYDLPVTGTAVFPPGTTASSTDLRPATVYAMDGNGDVVNVAGFNGTTQAGWAVSTTQYDELGNDVFDLSPQNRVYVTGSACAVAGLPTGCPSSILANALATISKYSGDGIDLTAVFSPTMTNVSLPNGIRGAARRRTSYSYGTVDYPYTTPSDYSTGGPAHDVIQQVEGASLSTVPYSTGEIGDLTTDYAYGLNSTDKAGWDYGSPESVITEMAGGSANYIVSQTKIDDATGMVVQTRQPSAAGVTSSPGTTVSTYYTVGTTNIANCVNTAWVGQLCKTAPGAQPTTSGLPGLPTTQATSYDYLLRPIVVTSTVTDAGGTQRTQTTTTSYDNGGVAGRVSSVVTTGGLGTSIPASTFYYDSSTGLPVVESNSVASSCVSAGPLCASYDDFGNQVGFTDTTGATTVISPTISDQPSTVTLKTPSGATVQTATYAYNGGSERRGLPTGLTYAGGSGYSSVGSYTASYDADGLLTAESLPDGSVMSQVADTNGQVTQKTWSSSSTLLWVEADDIYTIHGAVRQEGRPADGLFTTYSYDNAGRLGLAQEEYYDGQCTTRAYTLDKDSNRTGRDTFPPAVGGGCQSSGTPSASQSLSYDNADRLLSSGSASGVAYDAFGRMTSVPSSLVSGGSAVSVGYYTDDMVNTLTQGGVTQTWTLDPAGRDLASTQTGSSIATVNHFSALAGDSPSWSVVTSAGGVSATTVNDADLAGMLAATTSDTGSTMAITYQLTDARGDVLGTADPADPNELVTPVVADEFGNPTDIHGTTTTGPRYGWLGGHQRDASSISGVVLMGVRGYLPNVGRFVSVDPVPGGSANAYDYCDQDPINCLDLGGDRAHKKAHRIAKKIVQGFSYNSTFDAIVDIFNGRWHKAAKDFGLSNTVQFFQGLLSGKISKELAKRFRG
jgi:RHS repeat-associated protein